VERDVDGDEVTEWLEKLRRLLDERTYAYRKTFNGPLAEVVLRDLARFCRAHESTFDADPRASPARRPARSVAALQHHLKLTPDQLWELYSGRPANEE
jgi:hypothetical protein